MAAADEVVRHLAAMQAQDYGQALWAIGLRTQQSTVADIEQAIGARKIVRTWPMRGTIHFVAPEDAKWMLELSAPRMIAKDGRRQQQLGLDQAMMERCAELFSDALAGGKTLARSRMLQVLEDAGISTGQQRGYHILWYTSQTGLLCHGPKQDKEPTFVLLDEWVPASRKLSREESLVELAARYVAAHGPATVHDFAWWAGLTMSEAKAAFEAAKDGLTCEALDGKVYWISNAAAGVTTDDASGIQLLPGFDEYLLGYKDRSAVLAAEHATKIVPGNNGIFFPVIVVSGQVAGTWKRTIKKKSIDITLSPFSPLAVSEAAVAEAAERYSAFVGLSLGQIHTATP